MSDFSISAMSMASKAVDNQMAGVEASSDSYSTVMSGSSNLHSESEQAIVGTEVSSRTEDYIGAGPDFSSTGTDIDVQQAISTTLESGFGSIADVIA